MSLIKVAEQLVRADQWHARAIGDLRSPSAFRDHDEVSPVIDLNEDPSLLPKPAGIDGIEFLSDAAVAGLSWGVEKLQQMRFARCVGMAGASAAEVVQQAYAVVADANQAAEQIQGS